MQKNPETPKQMLRTMKFEDLHFSILTLTKTYSNQRECGNNIRIDIKTNEIKLKVLKKTHTLSIEYQHR